MRVFFYLLGLAILMLGEYYFLGQSLSKFNPPESQIFLTDILGLNIFIPKVLMIGLSLFDLILVFYLTKLLYSKKVGLIAAFLFSLCPWILFLSFAGEPSILLMTLVLLQLIGFTQRRFFLAQLIFLVSSLLLFASSVLVWPWVIGMLLLYLQKVKDKRTKTYLFGTVILILAICLISFIHLSAFKNIFKNQITIFNDVGLLNTVNQFQGETRTDNLFFIGRFVENKYIYLLEHFLFNFLSSISPVTFFTPQYKLLNFAFTPPIFMALIIPFAIWFLSKLKSVNITAPLYLLILLILPATLSQNAPDLNRLILIAPILLMVIASGIEKLLLSKTRLSRVLLITTLILFVFQSIVVISDISIREAVRLERSQETSK